MESWEAQCRQDGAVLACDSVICNEAPMTKLRKPAGIWEKRWHKTNCTKRNRPEPLILRLKERKGLPAGCSFLLKKILKRD